MGSSWLLSAVGAPVPEPTGSGSRPGDLVWTDPEGRVYAVCGLVDGAPRVVMPGVGRIVVRATEPPQVEANPFPDGDPEILLGSYYRFGLPLILQALGAEALHASAVVGPGGVVAFCADADTGKSTLAFGLAARGYRGWADDTLVFESCNEGVRAVGLPFRFRVEPEIARRLDPAGRASSRTPECIETAPLAGLCILRRQAQACVRVDRLDGPSAFRQVFRHALCFDLSRRGRSRLMFERYLDLADNLPVLEVGFRPDVEAMPELLDRVEAIVRRPETA